MKPFSKTLWIVLFALAMGYLESAVVVYLRELYYPEGFDFPMKEMAHRLAITELYREAATLVMIIAVSVLASPYRLHRFAWFLVIFSVWDLAYYVFLKVIIGWPSSLFTTDILFLLPSIWTGPVIAPVINSITMLLLASVIMRYKKQPGLTLRLSKLAWIFLVAGSILVLAAYMMDFIEFTNEYNRLHPTSDLNAEKKMLYLSTQFVPRSFNWLIFGTGVLMHFTAILITFIRNDKKSHG